MLKYNIEQINDIRVLSLEGQVSVMERHQLKDILDKEEETQECKYILDLSRVFYIDSMGIGFIQKLVIGHNNPRKLIIVSSKEYINYVIRFNKIHKLINVFFLESIEKAVEKFRKMS